MILDLFAGPGGWDEGLYSVAPDQARQCIGLEYDAAACSTRAAAGHLTIRADVTTLDPARLRGRLDGLIASPPCPDFSAAGKRAGITGTTGRLMREVPRWVDATRPRWVACEQVPPAVEWWETYALQFRALGYRTWVGILNAADYGVPQTRRRAFLLASLDRQPLPPEPTHCRGGGSTLFGQLAPWVSMAEALGWSETSAARPLRGSGLLERGGERRDHPATEPSPTVRAKAGGGNPGGFVRVNTRGERQTPGGNEFDPDGPSWALTEKTRSWRRIGQPAPTITGGGKEGIGSPEPIRDPKARAEIAADLEDLVVATQRDQRPDGSRQEVPVTEPAPTLTAGPLHPGHWELRTSTPDRKGTTRSAEEPAPTLAFGNDAASHRWELDRRQNGAPVLDPGEVPSPTMTGAAVGRGVWKATDVESGATMRLTISDALILQSFPADYPVQGTRTKQFEQVGNAVPPALAAAVLATLVLAR